MHPTRALVALALLAALLAGCAQSSPQDATGTSANTQQALLQRAAATVPPLQADIPADVAWWADFVTTHQKRDVFTPENAAARADLAAALQAGGYTVRDLAFQLHLGTGLGLPGVDVPQAGPLEVHVVEARRQGTSLADHAIAIGGHYDTQTGTLQGAYDNGSGAAAVVATCNAIAHVETRRTILCLLFDGEELGTLGSLGYLGQAGGVGPDVTIDAYLGFDMVGLNYPGKDVGDGTWKMFAWVGAEHADAVYPFVNATLHDVLGHPIAGVEAFPFNDRNSDEYSFAQRGIPTVRYAGGRTASDYPQYHMTGDNVDFVDDFAGGRAKFEAGFGAVVQAAYTQAVMLDATSLEELQATYG